MVIHFPGKNRFWFKTIIQAMRIIIGSAIKAFTERIKYRDCYGGERFYQVYERFNWYASPFRNSRPALYTMAHCDILLQSHCLKLFEGKLGGVFYQAAYFQLEIFKIISRQPAPFIGFGHLAIYPKVR